MQAIRTRYCGPTNTKGARVQASCEAKTIYVSWDHALSTNDNHKAAATELARRLAWTYPFSAMGWYMGDCYHVLTRL